MNRPVASVRVLRVAAILAVALATGAAEKACDEPLSGPDPTCQAAVDCRGLPHIACDGHWDCANGGCVWLCDAEPVNDSGPGGTDTGPTGDATEGCTADTDCAEGWVCDATTATCQKESVLPACIRTGCSGEICAPESMASICLWLDWYACLSLTVCERQEDGNCAFTMTEAVQACMAGDPCTVDADCPGDLTCNDGSCGVWSCVAKPEVCDEVDNDCDGLTDEGCAIDACRAVAAGTHGECKMLLGYFFDGESCFPEGGCACEPDCDAMFKTLAACEETCGVTCQSDGDCGVGRYCDLVLDREGGVSGSCAPLPEDKCVRDADCGDGNRCVILACPACFPCPCFGTCAPWTAPCSADADCEKGVCIGGVCVTGPGCTTEDDCPSYEHCANGTCVLDAGRCWDDADCEEDEACSGARICPEGALCILADEPGKCVAAGPVLCASDADCAAGTYCQWSCDGSAGGTGCTATCQPLADGICVKDADCDGDETCVKGPCPLCVNCPCFGVCEATATACTAVQPGSHGLCEMVLGYVFDGQQCVLESGCSCGSDCDAFFGSLEACKKACL